MRTSGLMSNRVSHKALRVVALVGILAGATALSGCSSMGSRMFADKTTTGSTVAGAQGTSSQPMPASLGPQSTRVAAGPFIPPSDIGGGSSSLASGYQPMPQGGQSSVTTNDLPVIASSTPGSSSQMSAQPAPAAIQVGSKPAALGATTPSPSLVSVPSNAYVHVIESGESLYTIARRYDVTAQAIVQANGFSSPDKIYVGQKIVIPGRPDLLASKGPARPVTGDDTSAAPSPQLASIEPNAGTPIPSKEALQTDTPVTTASIPQQQKPVLEAPAAATTSDKFRWPVSGRVITDFANSKGTGINIAAPEGAAIHAPKTAR